MEGTARPWWRFPVYGWYLLSTILVPAHWVVDDGVRRLIWALLMLSTVIVLSILALEYCLAERRARKRLSSES